ncbi:aromatic-ring-hydroxylating dioxygenase subunit beta [Shigella flexneri]
MRTTVNAERANAAKAFSHRAHDYNDAKTTGAKNRPSGNGHGRGREPPSRTRHLISNCQVSETDIPKCICREGELSTYRAQKERDETFYVGTRSTKFTIWKISNWRLLERDIVAGSSGNHFP